MGPAAQSSADQPRRDDVDRLRQLLELEQRERRLIAYEIHDGLIQELIGAKMMLESACDEIGAAANVDSLQRVIGLLDRAVKESRRLIGQLRPVDEEDEDVVQSIRELIRRHAEQGGADVQFTHELSTATMPSLLKIGVVRIVQEALANVRRHSGAKDVQLRLTERSGRLTIEIIDDGSGFDPDAVPADHMGLRGINERAHLLGGHSQIDSQPGRGTRILADLAMCDPIASSPKGPEHSKPAHR